MTPCYILKRTFTKAQQFNGGGAISQTGLPQNSISTSPSPITMTPCYILKRTFTKVNLINYPNNWGGGCYLANRITTKLYHHFPLPHYNDTVLYFKTIFDKSQPPQYPRHLGGYLKKQGHHKTSPLLTMTSCYILKQILTKANLLDSPNTGGGGWGYHTNRTTTKLYFPPYNNVVLYFKTIFYKRQPPQFPQQLGVVISQTGLPQNSTSPPYNDVVLHSKANFYKSQPPQFPQQKSQNIIFG